MQLIRYEEHLLVKRNQGTMPIILTCPHGGTEAPDDVPNARKEADTPADCDDFNTSADTKTPDITEDVTRKILELTGLSPYVVIARFKRDRIDANRKAECAFTDPNAQKYYDEYHNRIDEYINELLDENDNRGFLFDIHSNANDDADIFLGTRDGRSLMPTFDRDRLFMRHGLQGLLVAVQRLNLPLFIPPIFQYRVDPPDRTASEIYNGQFTVKNYGSRLNCIQIEIAKSIWNNGIRRAAFAEDLAYALINFVRRYAPF